MCEVIEASSRAKALFPASPRIAIVGSGPSGCYTAQALRRKLGPDVTIEIFEALEAPYGLARYGVAADHPGTRAITRQFDRLFERDGVVLRCGFPVGAPEGVPLTDLRANYDAVVLAVGLPDDRPLGIAGTERQGLIGAGRLLRTLNGHPELRVDPFPLGPAVAIVGAGNVAMDAVRLLARPAEELTGSGIDEAVLAAFTTELRTVHILSRSLPDGVKADLTLLREIAEIDGVAHRMHFGAGTEGSVGAEGERSALLRAMAERDQEGAPHRLRIEWWFEYQLIRIEGEPRVRGIAIAPRDAVARDAETTLDVDTIITAIGFTRVAGELGPFPGDEIAATGRVASGLYVAGWLRRGSQGTIASQRADARELAEVIAADLESLCAASTLGPDVARDDAVTLTWRVNPMLLDYLHRLDDFTATASGEASYSPESGVRIVGSERDGVFSAEHGVVMHAHDGAFALHLESLRVEDDVLWIRDPLGGEGQRLKLAELQEVEALPGERRFITRLTSEAEPLFNFVYPPGTEFAPLALTRSENRT